MIPKISLLITLALLSFYSDSYSQHSSKKLALDTNFINQQLNASAEQILVLAAATPEDKFPQNFSNSKHNFSSSSWWCSGFYPGTLLLLSEATLDGKLKDLALSKLKYLQKEQYNKGTHDLGFMLYCSFGNALRLTKDSLSYLPILKNGAESLISRYNPTTKTIRSWDNNKWKYPVIIDNMMNLEFLMEVSKMTGNTAYSDIAKTHALTTMKNHYRKDFSSYHVIDYDPETGIVLSKQTHQGAADESAWARGQAWGLYGFIMMYRETHDKAFLNFAKNIASFILNHPELPSDLIPYWDFDQHRIPAESSLAPKKTLRDASAAALLASCLLELSEYTKGNESQNYLSKAESIIRTLSSDEYFSKNGENGGFLLKHSVGALPMNSEVDVALSYADYYYVEALLRYQRILAGEKMIQN